MGHIIGRIWRDGQLTAPTGDAVLDLDTLDALLAREGTLVWVDLIDPDPEHLALLGDRLGIDPHAIEDAVMAHERPKVTRRSAYTFMTTYATSLSSASAGDDGAAAAGARTGAGGRAGSSVVESRLRTAKVSAFVVPRGLLTVREADNDVLDIEDVTRRWDDTADLMTGRRTDVGVLVHGLLDAIVDGHFDTIQQLDDAIEDIEGMLFDGQVDTAAVQRQIYRLRKELVELRRVVLPMREVVNGLLRHRDEIGAVRGQGGQSAPAEATADSQGQRADRPLDAYYDDLYDHVLRAAEWTESLRDMVTTVFETNLSLQDARLNTVMKQLAAWAAIIAVPTAVTGWFGQNVPYPGFGDAAGFWQSLTLIIVLSSALYLVFKRRDWL